MNTLPVTPHNGGNKGALSTTMVLLAVLAGVFAAAAFGFVALNPSPFMIFIAYASPLPLFVSGLALGVMGAAISATAGMMTIALAAGMQLGMAFLLIIALPVVFISWLALRHRIDSAGVVWWYPEGRMLTAIVTWIVVIFALALLSAWDRDGGLLGGSTRMIEDMVTKLQGVVDEETSKQLMQAFKVLPRWLPTLFGMSWAFLMIINAVCAQAIVKSRNWNIREGFCLRRTYASAAMLGIVIAAGLGSLLADPWGYIALNIAAICCLPFFITGIAVVHAWAATQDMKSVILTVFYILLAVFIYALVVVVVVGIIDQLFNLRQKLTPKINTSN